MKIALVAPVIRAIKKDVMYGGIERIITSLVFGLSKKGFEVFLYAPKGTDLAGKNINVIELNSELIGAKATDIREAELSLFEKIVAEQDKYDLIHTHIEPMIAQEGKINYYEKITNCPLVVTMHNQTHIQKNIDYYTEYLTSVSHINYVFISYDQREPLSFVPKSSVIYNGIKLHEFEVTDCPEDYLFFLGRLTPEKGIVEAIMAAKKIRKKLLIVGGIDKSQEEFFLKEVKPLIDGENIIYLGEINNYEKNRLLGLSKALLFPINWHEPFGLVMVESLACGTPVIATNIGSVSEIIENGKMGIIASKDDYIEQIEESFAKCQKINRKMCRESVENRFSEEIMVSNYLKLYNSLY